MEEPPIFLTMKGEQKMEANEIMTNEEVMETTTEEIVKASSAGGFKTAAVFGLVFIAGYVAGKFIIDPAMARIKARKLSERTVERDDFEDFEETTIVSEEKVEDPE